MIVPISTIGRPSVKSLTTTLAASKWYKPTEIMVRTPFACKIDRIELYYPTGCENLVQLRFGVKSYEYLTDWLTSGDQKSLTLSFDNVELEEGSEIWMEAKNLDTTYTHTPVVEVILKPIDAIKKL